MDHLVDKIYDYCFDQLLYHCKGNGREYEVRRDICSHISKMITKERQAMNDPQTEPDPIICPCGWEMEETAKDNWRCPKCGEEENTEPDYDSMKGGPDYDG